MEKKEFRAQAAPWNRAVQFMLMQGDAVATNIEMTPHQPGMMIAPFIELDIDDAQTLMDDLWHAGLRPTEGSGSAGSLRATENHLKDMQKIVYKKLDIK